MEQQPVHSRKLGIKGTRAFWTRITVAKRKEVTIGYKSVYHFHRAACWERLILALTSTLNKWSTSVISHKKGLRFQGFEVFQV